jgi:hypothetical protein
LTAPQIKAFNDWYCPECGLTERTRPLPNRWHTCPKLKMLTVQMVRKGVNAKISVVERQDYVANERVQLLGEDKRPIMSVVITRDDGQDVTVFAPAATARSS